MTVLYISDSFNLMTFRSRCVDTVLSICVIQTALTSRQTFLRLELQITGLSIVLLYISWHFLGEVLVRQSC